MKIDLSKCKIGTTLKLRNGAVTTLKGKLPQSLNYPYITTSGQSYLENGREWRNEESELDIVAILPTPKKPRDPLANVRRELAEARKNEKSLGQQRHNLRDCIP
jgi:hypothetical protein